MVIMQALTANVFMHLRSVFIVFLRSQQSNDSLSECITHLAFMQFLLLLCVFVLLYTL